MRRLIYHKRPLETGTAVEPNIFFMLDDSGSMMLGFVGDRLESKISVPGCTKYILRRFVDVFFENRQQSIFSFTEKK